MLFTCAGVIFAVAAAAGLLAMGADALAMDFLYGVTTPWARVFRLTTYFAACTAAATRVADLGFSAVCVASAFYILI